MRTVERSRDRKELVREAGISSISFISALAGVLVAYGAVLLLLAVAAGIGEALGFDTAGISENEWRDIGIGAVVAIGVVLFLSYFFGGYVAGRMGRRSGLAHGLLVFVLGIAVVAGAAAAASVGADGEAIGDELRNQGIPTGADDWRDVGLFGGIGVLAAMLVGSLLGGVKGERWHGVLVTRALDPEVRPRGAEDDDHRRDDRDLDSRDVDDREVRDNNERTMTIPARGTGDETTSSPAVSREGALDNMGTPADAHADDDRHDAIDLTDAERLSAEERDASRVTRRD